MVTFCLDSSQEGHLQGHLLFEGRPLGHLPFEAERMLSP